MKNKNQIHKIMARRKGIATTAQIEAAGVGRVQLKRFVAGGRIHRERHGVYVSPGFVEDEMTRLQSKYPRGIFSLGTALWLHKITDRTPVKFTLTFPRGYHAASLQNENVNRVFANKNVWGAGIVNVKNSYGETVRAYDMERTVCEVMRKRNSLGIELVTDAVRQYAARRDKNLHKLMQYAELFRVTKPLRAYLEVLT